jgi:hypothetical protein
MARRSDLDSPLLGSVTGKPRRMAATKTARATKRIPKPSSGPHKPSQESPQRQLLNKAQAKLIKEILGGTRAWAKAHAQKKKSKSVGLENIVGVTIGHKHTRGKAQPAMALLVIVKKKLKDPRRINRKFRIPPTITVDGKKVPTDIVQATITPHGVNAGQKVGLAKTNLQGTMACVCVVDDGSPGGLLCFLSNNHVLANANSALAAKKAGLDFDQIKQADLITSPGGSAGTHVGRLWDFAELDFRGALNTVDCAVAATTRTLADPLITNGDASIEIQNDHRRVAVNDVVAKIGAFSGFTRGVVTSTVAELMIPYGPGKTAHFTNLIHIDPVGGSFFSQNGDSGSLVVDPETNIPVALHMAGNDPSKDPPPYFSFACDLDAVMNALAITALIGNYDVIDKK